MIKTMNDNFLGVDVCKLFFRLPYQDDMFWRFAVGGRSYNMRILQPPSEFGTKEEAMRAINEIEKFERDSKFATIKAQKEVEE